MLSNFLVMLNRICSSCQFSKSRRLAFGRSARVSPSPFYLVHSDIWGPSPVPSVTGYRYYISFVDDYSRFTWKYPLAR
jgi:hypothetical protein